jgi:DNA polymerase III subunit alpha
MEGYDESYEFRIFGEEYLKFRHFLIQNNFTYIKVAVKEGWADKETGKKGEPRMQFLLVQYLQDVLPTFAKKLIIHLNIHDLQSEMITKLSSIFQSNKGEHNVDFEVLELETVKRQIEVASSEILTDSDEIAVEEETLSEDNPPVTMTTEVEETRVVTRLQMPSRKLKIKISGELLQELEKMQVNFKLN